ncbi:MAG: HAD-IA family hydrolase [Candidatus Woesebacteria bacterium]|jgi:putative hydrolase of the HAD superfamily
MINTILSDFSLVILFPKDKTYTGKLNDLHAKLTAEQGDYNFFEYFELNQELLDFYKQLKENYSVNVFTTGVVQNVPAVREIIDPIFDNIHTAKDYGVDKKDPEAYKLIAEKLGKRTEEILFTDDKEKNITAAKEAGLTAISYKNVPQLKNDLEKILNE